MQSKAMTTNKDQGINYPKTLELVSVVIFAVLVCLLGFIFVIGVRSDNHTNPALAYARQTQQALNNATPTPTPFQPAVVDPSSQVAEGFDPVDDPNIDPDNDIDEESDNDDNDPKPTPTTTAWRKPDGQVNILLLGSDVRPDGGGFRTDVIVLVSLNPKDGFVSAVSFPRDLYVFIPGVGNNRINVAFPRGGFETLGDTLEYNFGVRPDHYMMIDFNGFKTVINNLGGIDVMAEKNLSDSCAKWINASGYCSVGPGLVHMDGEVALWYARSRYSTNDIDRSRRTQEVIEAIFNRLMSLDAILQAPDLYKVYKTYVQTDLGFSDIVPLLPLASKIYQNGDIRNYVIGYDHAYDWMTQQGAQVLVPDIQLIQDLLAEALMLE